MAFIPIFTSDVKSSAAKHKAFLARAHLAYHLALDHIYKSLAALRKGILWELYPRHMLLLLIQVYSRIFDYPDGRLQLIQMISASSRCPCPYCHSSFLTKVCLGPPKALLIAQAPAGKPHMSVKGWSAVRSSAPKGTPLPERRLQAVVRGEARSMSSLLAGRTPAPLTRTALSVSSRVASGGAPWAHSTA